METFIGIVLVAVGVALFTAIEMRLRRGIDTRLQRAALMGSVLLLVGGLEALVT